MNEQYKIIIAIDGHSSSGKSTLAKALARKLGYKYIDTGAMYRAVTLFFLENNIDWKNEAEVKKALKNIKIEFKQNTNFSQSTYLNGLNVEEEIRSMKVSNSVSDISTIEEIRKVMVNQQQEMGKQKGIVMDGRDIGTVVFPDAELKFFLTASNNERSKRRWLELKSKGVNITLEEIKHNITSRDHIDSTRQINPLKKADDAITIDSSNLTEKEMLSLALKYVKKIIEKKPSTLE